MAKKVATKADITTFGEKHGRQFLAKSKKFADFPDLLLTQKNWFQTLIDNYIVKLFDDINPIYDMAGERLYLTITDIKVGDAIETVDVCKKKELTYGGIISWRLKLHDSETKKVMFNKQVNIWILPLMTKWWSYVVSGVERVIISQITRSYGIFFNYDKRNLTQSFKIIPENGSWIQIFTEKSGRIVVRINNSRKFLVTALLRVFWFESDESIRTLFEDNIDEDDFDYISETLAKDTVTTAEDAAVYIYGKMRPGEIIDPESALDYIKTIFLDPERMKLGQVARRKINVKLDIEKKVDADTSQLFDGEDLVAALKYLINLANKKRWFFYDDIDHLANRRVRSLGETLFAHLTPVMRKFTKSIKGKLSVLDLSAWNRDPKEIKIDIETSKSIIATYKKEMKTDEKLTENELSVLENKLVLLTSELEHAKTNKWAPPPIKLTSLANFKILDNSIKSFFATSQLSQFLDQVNPLAEIEHKRRITALGPWGLKRETATFEVRDVHPSHYGRICPIETPEWQNIGLVTYQSLYSKINEYGFVETPAMKLIGEVEAKVEVLENRILDEDIKDGKKTIVKADTLLDAKLAKAIVKASAKWALIKVRPYVSDEVEYISPEYDEKYIIADISTPIDEHGNLTEKRVPGRHFMTMEMFYVNDLTHVDVNPSQIFSPNTSIIPFVDHDDAVRASMGTNMQRQAVPLIKPEAPLVGTGLEWDIADMTYAIIKAEGAWEVIYVDGKRIKVKYKKDGIKEYDLVTFKRSNQKTVIHQRPKVSLGQKIKKGDVLLEGPSVVDGEIALGKNLRVAFMSWEWYNYEDAVVISQRLVKDDELTSININEYEIEVADTKLGPEETTNDIPWVSLAKLKHLDEEGIIRVWSSVRWWDLLVGKISPKSEGELSPEEKLIQAIFGDKSKSFKDSSLYLPAGSQWKVIEIVVLDSKKWDNLNAWVKKKIKVYVASTRKIEVWDKLAGRHGNKGIIAIVVPEEDMPYTEGGQSIDVCLNPLWVISRMNIWQTFETQLWLIANALDTKFAVPLFSGFDSDQLEKLMVQAWFEADGKMHIYDGRNGEKYKNKVTVWYMNIIKLVHMVEDKIHARSVGPYSLITQQPLWGKARSGWQRFGEMEVWALEAYSAVYTLQEMLTIKSDDVTGRNATYKAIIEWWKISIKGLPESFNLVTYLFKWLGQSIVPLREDQVEKIHEERIKKITTLWLKWITGEEGMAAVKLVEEDKPEKKEKVKQEKAEMMEEIVKEMKESGDIDE